MHQPDLVSVVILNWNGAAYLADCIASLKAQTYRKLEIIVVDNGSTDGSLKMLAAEYPEFPVHANGKNLGFAEGMNVGVARSRGEFVLLLNEDTYLAPDFIEHGVKEMLDHPRIGWTGGVVYALSDGERTQRLVNAGYLLRKRFQLTTSPRIDARHEVLMANNCAMFLRRTALDDVRDDHGWLDREYFAYWEDTDLALRLCLKGWGCSFLPQMRMWHVISGSFGGRSRLIDKPPALRRISLRNRYRTLIKDLPLGMLIELGPFLLLTEILIVPYFLFLSPRTLLCNLGAIGDAVRGLPALLSQRSAIQRGRRVAHARLRSFFAGW
ncbi:glycosyltransferase family 2 protein [Geomonas azotofigens]|uniref:glycosyltransferase family 2 protein n=1 Tax=Geomonas azotofigens TaxID=2843196 RepID=UPI001C0FA23B|nr:glycosyltransferase family 2 protein [Geomonas azotofigens]MBU5613386.1 glycosyltransferase family 2 protein [Geomonas azotofigens]